MKSSEFFAHCYILTSMLQLSTIKTSDLPELDAWIMAARFKKEGPFPYDITLTRLAAIEDTTYLQEYVKHIQKKSLKSN
jgi:hypothetical protein